MTVFALNQQFLDTYKDKQPEFGWNGLGEVVFLRTYSRSDNPKTQGLEKWHDVCERVINGMYQIQQDHMTKESWDSDKAQRSAQEAFDLMFRMKWSPPGRGLWMMGTDFVMNRGVSECLQNCAFISSKHIYKEKGSFFSWIMHMSMLGVGVGFDTEGKDILTINKPKKTKAIITIPDTREGWVKSVELLINSYLMPERMATIEFDYKDIRPKGEPINGFGGIASGPDPLRQLHRSIREVLNNKIGEKLGTREIVDLANMIGRCVIAGNVRRSAEIAFGQEDDETFIDLKDYNKYPERIDYGWASNNSVFITPESDVSKLAERTWHNGEPGFAWLDNVHNYGRMNGIIDTTDEHALGFNPCGEQPLGHKEMCTLVEIYLPHIKSKEEFRRVIKFAYLYGKTVTLASANIEDGTSREIMANNRRIGLSLTGITQFVGKHGNEVLKDWMDHGYHWSGDYDRIYSQWFDVPTSIRRTSVKPSGTVSLVAGVTPGIHYNVEGRFHIRRVTLADNSPLVEPLQAAGYHVEPAVIDPDNSVVVEFPVDAGVGVRSEADVQPMEHLELIADVARFWADNAVSATVKFDKEEYGPEQLTEMINWSKDKVKDIAFLPLSPTGAYQQAPYESITEEEYNAKKQNLQPLVLSAIGDGDKQADLYCDGDACEI